MILFFSGTGNSKFLAEKAAVFLNDKTINLNERIKNQDYSSIESESSLVFILPTYSWNIPRIIEDYIKEIDFIGNKNAYFILNCGSDIGNADRLIKSISKEKGFILKGVKEIIMPENYTALFYTPNKEEADQIIKRGEGELLDTLQLIKENKQLNTRKITLLDKIKSSIVQDIFYKFIVKDAGFWITEGCISCDKCKDVCPVNNIKIVNSKPVWQGSCTHCMACIGYCPREAIEYKKRTLGKRKYTFEKICK